MKYFVITLMALIIISTAVMADELTEEERQWVRSRMNDEAAMGRIAKRFRGLITYLMLVAGACIAFWDKLKSGFQALVKAAIAP